MGNFVEDVCALVSIMVERQENEDAWTDGKLAQFAESCEDKDNMLIMMAAYMAGDFTKETWQERLQDFWPAWSEVVEDEGKG